MGGEVQAMEAERTLVLIAGVSAHERRAVESTLESSGFGTVLVNDARHAEKELAVNGSCVLVIDSGLLQAPHDGQWRNLRSRHPQLGTVVRRLIARANTCLPVDDATLLVHPDDDVGLRQAIRVLVAARHRQDPPAPSRASRW
jgi:hypothetical protein